MGRRARLLKRLDLAAVGSPFSAIDNVACEELIPIPPSLHAVPAALVCFAAEAVFPDSGPDDGSHVKAVSQSSGNLTR